MFHFSLLIGFSILTLSIEARNKIKECKLESTCVNKNKLLKFEIFFNVLPSKVTTGELISNSDSSITFKSEPSLSKNKKQAIYFFTPDKADKYTMKFNSRLLCPQVITVKNEFKLDKMHHTLFITEERKAKPLNFSVKFEFDKSISFQDNFINSDISRIDMVENVNKSSSELEEERFTRINDCFISNTVDDTNNGENTTLVCNIKKDKGLDTDTRVLSFYYTDRCGERNLLSHIFIMTKPDSIIENETKKNEVFISYLNMFKAYNIREYQDNRKTMIAIAISKEKISCLESLYSIVAPVANQYPEYCFVFANWEEDEFLMKHYEVQNDGNIKIIINNFYNDNVYIGNLEDYDSFNKLISDMANQKLVWTRQNWLQKVSLYLMNKDLSEEEEKRVYFSFGVIGFILLIILRCYLYQRKKNREDNLANFATNPKKNN